MQEVIRARETLLQGDINPVLRDFGSESEARQYSGRNVEASWKAPFAPTAATPDAAEVPVSRRAAQQVAALLDRAARSRRGPR